MNKSKNQGYGNALKNGEEMGINKKMSFSVKILDFIEQLILKINQ